MLRDSARKFLSDNAGIETLRALGGARPPRGVRERGAAGAVGRARCGSRWSSSAGPRSRCPKTAGGAGMKMVAVAALAEEVGRAALVSPLITTLLATCVLRERRDAGGDAALARIVGGEAAALAITNADGSWEPGDTDVTAKATATASTLNGTASFVQDARKVGVLRRRGARRRAASASTSSPPTRPGVTIQPDRIVDLTRDQARVALRRRDALPAAHVVAAPGEGGGGRCAGAAGAAHHRRRRPVRRRRVAAADDRRRTPRCASSSTTRSASSRR